MNVPTGSLNAAPRTPRSRRRRFLINPSRFGVQLAGVAFLAFLFGSSTGCTERAEAKARLPSVEETLATPIRVTTPQRTIAASSTELTGTIRSQHESTLSAKASGQIVALSAEVGDRVKKGQVLVQLDVSQASTSLSSARAAKRLAEANASHAQLEMERTATLFERGALADAALDGAKTQHDVGQAQLEQSEAAVLSAQQRIADSVVRAPFAGVVSARYMSQGEMATATPPSRLITLVDPDALEVRLNVPESLLPYVKTGDKLRGTVSPSGKALEVEVTARSSLVDERTRTVEVLARVVRHDLEQLLVGMLVSLDASTSPRIEGPFLPAAALHKDERGHYVLVVEGESLEQVRVEARALNPGIYSVPVGLPLNAVVALDEGGDLQAGDKVRVVGG